MRILFAASEAVPFCKTGGLADVAGSLPQALARSGDEVAVILPLYQRVAEKWKEQMSFVCHIEVPLGWRRVYCGLFRLDRDGVMVGGAIVPGVGVSLDALTHRAALLSSVSLEAPAHVVGRDTAECLQSGVLYGAAAMLDGLCDRMEEELGYPCRVIATGGLAGLVVRHCRRKVECSDTLLLDGLKVIYQQVVSDGNS